MLVLLLFLIAVVFIYIELFLPGGVFGVVQHRGNGSAPQDPKAESGYINQDHVIALAKKAGCPPRSRTTRSSAAPAGGAASRPSGSWRRPVAAEWT